MSKAGWYPDPGGQPGKYRYWDGTTWSPTVTDNPYSPPPGASMGQPYGAGTPTPKAKTSVGSWLALGLVGIVVIALVWGGFQLLSGGGLSGLTPKPPVSNPTDDFCPKRKIFESPSAPINNPGRVQGGKLSYPMLGTPWGAPAPEVRVPFGRDAVTQVVPIEENYDGKGHSWVASVLVAELVAGDGFFGPEQGAEIVGKCIMGEFYGDAELTRKDIASKAVTVDGKQAWLLEMHFDFQIEGLHEKGETAIVIVVATGEESSSLYYASIPDSRPDLLQQARALQSQLRVEP